MGRNARQIVYLFRVRGRTEVLTRGRTKDNLVVSAYTETDLQWTTQVDTARTWKKELSPA